MTILRVCMASGTQAQHCQVTPGQVTLTLLSSAGTVPAGVESSVLLVSCVNRSKVRGWWTYPRL